MARTRPENRAGSGNTQSQRGDNGRFVTGVSGNPGGRPRDTEHVAELARNYTTEAIETLVRLMRNGDERVQAHAATALLDRGWGKPKETVFVDQQSERQREAAQRMEELRDLRKNPETAAALLVLANATAKAARGAT